LAAARSRSGVAVLRSCGLTVLRAVGLRPLLYCISSEWRILGTTEEWMADSGEVSDTGFVLERLAQFHRSRWWLGGQRLWLNWLGRAFSASKLGTSNHPPHHRARRTREGTDGWQAGRQDGPAGQKYESI